MRKHSMRALLAAAACTARRLSPAAACRRLAAILAVAATGAAAALARDLSGTLPNLDYGQAIGDFTYPYTTPVDANPAPRTFPAPLPHLCRNAVVVSQGGPDLRLSRAWPTRAR